MLSFWMLVPIIIYLISFVMGLLFFYVSSSLDKEVKKKQLEEITSFMIHFVIFIWIGKIVLHLSIFFQDPLAILAYPSNSQAFYIAVICICINIVYKAKRNQINAFQLVFSFMPVFLGASFVYEFIQFIWYNSTYSFGYLGLLMILIVVYLLFMERISSVRLLFIILIGWSAGQLIFSFVLPFTTVFGYMLAPAFFISFFLLSAGMLIRANRK